MASKARKVINYTETISLAECKDGYWLYDTTRGMNLAIREPTSEDAFIQALTYYQERLKIVESDLQELQNCIKQFYSFYSG